MCPEGSGICVEGFEQARKVGIEEHKHDCDKGSVFISDDDDKSKSGQ